MNTLLDDATAVMAETLNVEFATFLQQQSGGQELLFKAGRGWEPELVGKATMPAAPQFLCGYALTSDKSTIVEDVAAETRFRSHPLAASHDVVSEMACVVPGREQPHGVLCAHSTAPRRFSEDDARFLQTLANVLAAALERRLAEDELNRFFEPSLNPMFVAGFDGTIKRCNRAMELLMGYANEELVGQLIPNLVHPDDQQATVAEIKRQVAGGEIRAFECRAMCKDGSQKWTVWNSTPFADWQVFYATGQDVTDRHRAEEALTEQARRQQAVAELGARALSGGDLDALLDDAVAVLAGMLKVEFTTFLERPPNGRDLLFKAGYGWPPELIGKSMTADPQHLCGRVLVSDQPIVVDDLSTETRFLPHPLASSLGIVSEMVCVVPGRTDPHGVLCAHAASPRRFSEDEVRFQQSVANILAAAIERGQAEEELKRFFEPSLSPMFVAGFDGAIKQCNHAMEELFGCTREELLSRTLQSFGHPDDLEAAFAELQKLAAGGDIQAFETRIVRQDGSERWTSWSGKAFVDWQVFYATGQDVTDRRLAEEALRASEETLRAISAIGAGFDHPARSGRKRAPLEPRCGKNLRLFQR